jgi:hypothetical protein
MKELPAGHYTQASQAVWMVKRKRGRKLERLRRELIQLEAK